MDRRQVFETKFTFEGFKKKINVGIGYFMISMMLKKFMSSLRATETP
jgi:hypothetical protein